MSSQLKSCTRCNPSIPTLISTYDPSTLPPQLFTTPLVQLCSAPVVVFLRSILESAVPLERPGSHGEVDGLEGLLVVTHAALGTCHLGQSSAQLSHESAAHSHLPLSCLPSVSYTKTSLSLELSLLRKITTRSTLPASFMSIDPSPSRSYDIDTISAIIHTVGPMYYQEDAPAELLAASYR